MKTRLLLKQSFKDFKSKWIIYITFTAFLILVLSVIVGLFSFTIGLNEEINVVNTKNVPNALTSSFNYRMSDEEVSNNESYLTISKDSGFITFTEQLIKEVSLPIEENELKAEAKIMLEITGTFAGTLTSIDQTNRNYNEVIKNINDDQIEKYNNLIAQIQITNFINLDVNVNFKTLSNNLLISYFIFQLNKDQDVYAFNSSENTIGYDTLVTWLSPEKWMPTYDQESKILKNSKILNTYYFETINLKTLDSNQQQYFDNSQYTFVTQKTMKKNNYHLGDIIEINNNKIIEEKLLLGVATNSFTLNQPNNTNVFFVPFSQLKDRQIFKQNIYVDVAKAHNMVKGQEWLNQKFSNDFISENNEKIFPKLQDIQLPTVYNIETEQLYQALAIVVAIGLLTLLIFVFYFITQQIIFSQRKTLFFLKAIGVSNGKISLLTTLAIISPMIITFILAFGLGLFIQNMMFEALGSAFSYIPNPMAVNWYYCLILSGLLFLMSAIFFVLNLKIIKSKLLTIQGINAFKAPGRLSIAFQSIALRRVSNRVRIGFSFTIKNIYKNLVTVVLLSLSFGIIIFVFQFLQSVNYSLTSYHQWNEPYKSVYSNNRLNPIRYEEGEWKQDFTTINAKTIEDTDLIPVEIDNLADIFGDLKLNMDKYYIPDELIALIASDQGKTYINQNVLPKLTEQQQKDFLNFYNQVTTQYSLVKSKFGASQKINILFGKMLNPSQFRSEETLLATTRYSSFSLIAISKNDSQGIERYKTSKNKMRTVNKKLELDVSISEGFASWYELKKKSKFEIKLPNYLDSSGNPISVLCNIKNIIIANPLTKEMYTTQEDLLNYITTKDNKNTTTETRNKYLQLLDLIDNDKINLINSVYCDSDSPIGLTNLTLPFTSGTGTKILDYQNNEAYFNNIQDSIFPFKMINDAFEARSAPFVKIMTNFLIITIFTLFSVSLILITLILLDNREIILLMKSIGYRNLEIEWYLTFGYVIAAFIAMVVGVFFADYFINFCSNIFYKNIGSGIAFLWNYQLILFTILLGISFVFGIIYASKYFIIKQKPKDAFTVL